MKEKGGSSEMVSHLFIKGRMYMNFLKKGFAAMLALLAISMLPGCKGEGREEMAETTTAVTETTVPETTATTTSTTTTTTTTTASTTTSTTTTTTTTTTEAPTEWISPLEGYNALDLMSVSAADFAAGVNWNYTELGQRHETAAYALVADLFPGYDLYYGGMNFVEDGSYPKNIYVNSGMITDSTWAGMSYTELLSALGEPNSYGLALIDGDFPCMSYNINGFDIYFYFYDTSANRWQGEQLMDDSTAARTCLEEVNPSVTHACLSN